MQLDGSNKISFDSYTLTAIYNKINFNNKQYQKFLWSKVYQKQTLTDVENF